MVVPVERVSKPQKIKQYVGNNLNLSIFSNKRLLMVTGNKCKIQLSENSGQIKVIGDYCDITVLKGSGNIEYIGNYGKINLGLDVSEDTVTYVGNGGEICSNNSSYEKTTTLGNSTCDESTKRSKGNTIHLSDVTKIRHPTMFLPSAIHIPIPNVQIRKQLKREKTKA